ncbi:type IA DNA topoisomerase [Robertmurraya sp. FSL R5-0851]|uniref:type IA DNA topoisomerase n=1 Tax=Robertmurraya sp. FSL R5-0851 TaxID=2921584 RepID=UPI0030F926D8
MGRMLLCAEKPAQARKLCEPFKHTDKGNHIVIAPCEIFPEGAVAIWAVGHILELFAPSDYSEEYKTWTLESLPIIPSEYKLKPTPDKRKILNNYKKWLRDPSVSTIVHCGDPAGEGQLLINEILTYFSNKKPVKRFWASSLTKDAVIRAFKTMKDNTEYESLNRAAIARQRADWVVGISTSRALTCLLNQKGINKTFSAGRVQSALAGIIYQREQEIENFVSKPYFDLFAQFQFGEAVLMGKWISKDSEHIFDMDEELIKAFADFCQTQPAKVHSVTQEEKRVKPPQLYNLSALQIHANKLFGMSPAAVLGFCQSLYDKSLLTYPRSDSRYLTEGESAWMPTILNNLSKYECYQELVNGATLDISQNKRFTDSSKVSDHYAMIPTEEAVNPLELPKGEQQIYDLVAKSVIAAHYPDFVYDSTEILTTIQDQFAFKSKGNQTKHEGWKTVYKGIASEEKAEAEVNLPTVKEGQIGKVLSTEIKGGSTAPPSRFTQGDLIGIMVNASHYCKDKGDFRKGELSLGTEATRASIVNTLTARYVKIVKNQVFMLPEGKILIEALGLNSYVTSVLTTGHMERYLKEIEKGKGNLNSFVKRTEDITREIVEQLVSNAEKWDFSAFIKEIQKAEEVGTCKLCGGVVIERDTFYGCSNYSKNNCTFRIPKTMSEKTISKENAKKLLTTGQTALIKNFVSKKKEKTFDAFLAWDENQKKLTYRFPN